MGLLGIFSSIMPKMSIGSPRSKTTGKKEMYYIPNRINKEAEKPLIHNYIIKFNRSYKKPVKFHISAYSPRNAYEKLVYKYSFKSNPILYNYQDAIIREKKSRTTALVQES